MPRYVDHLGCPWRGYVQGVRCAAGDGTKYVFFWMFTSQRRLLRRCECEMVLPKPGPGFGHLAHCCHGSSSYRGRHVGDACPPKITCLRTDRVVPPTAAMRPTDEPTRPRTPTRRPSTARRCLRRPPRAAGPGSRCAPRPRRPTARSLHPPRSRRPPGGAADEVVVVPLGHAGAVQVLAVTQLQGSRRRRPTVRSASARHRNSCTDGKAGRLPGAVWRSCALTEPSRSLSASRTAARCQVWPPSAAWREPHVRPPAGPRRPSQKAADQVDRERDRRHVGADPGIAVAEGEQDAAHDRDDRERHAQQADGRSGLRPSPAGPPRRASRAGASTSSAPTICTAIDTVSAKQHHEHQREGAHGHAPRRWRCPRRHWRRAVGARSASSATRTTPATTASVTTEGASESEVAVKQAEAGWTLRPG